MAVMKSKGTVLKMTVTATLTAIPGIVSIEKAGEEGESMDIRSLDSAVGLPMSQTGHVKPPTITIELLLDRANAVHAALYALMRAPANNVLNLVYTDTGPVTEAWTCVTVGIDESFEGTKAVSAKVKFTLTGSATIS